MRPLTRRYRWVRRRRRQQPAPLMERCARGAAVGCFLGAVMAYGRGDIELMHRLLERCDILLTSGRGASARADRKEGR